MLDKYIGIPFLFLLKLFSHKKNLPGKINKIGILTVPAIGDVILMSGLLKDVRKFDPGIKIFLFVTKEVKEIAELMGSFDEIIPVKLHNPFRAIKTLRRHPVDIFIDASQWARLNAILTFFSGSGYKIGFKTKGQCKHLIFNFAAEHSDLVHELYNYKKLSFTKEMKNDSLPEIRLEEDIPVKSKRVVIHIMPGGYLAGLKEWPDENWRRVIEHLMNRGCEIYFTGSKSDYERIEKVLGDFKNNRMLHNIAGRYQMRETALLLKSSQLVICVNTGIMHLASALGCNLIALHGPTNPLRWGPLNSNSKIIQSDYPEAPCLNLGFEYNCKDRTGECMKRITPVSVISAVEEFGL